MQVPEFSIYDNDTELHVKICKYESTVTLTDAELESLKEAHFGLFAGLLKLEAPYLKCCFEKAEKSYLVVPLHFTPFLEPLVAFIDFDLAHSLAVLKPNPEDKISDFLTPVPWPTSLDMFRDRIVIRNYVSTFSLYEVTEVSPTINLSSPPDFDAHHSTFKEYFQEKYRCTFTDDTQPALVCQQLGESDSRFQLLTSRFKTHGGADVQKSKRRCRKITLFPEVCNLYPLPTSCWKFSRCISSILWRVECVLTVDTLRVRVASETGIGRFPDGSELMTSVSFSGYKDMAFGELDSQKLITNSDGELEVVSAKFCDPLEPPLRGPNNSLLLQALIPRGASDSVNLERLETLGDSLLKFSTTVFLYHDRAAAHEGKLSEARSRRISNLNLYRLAKRKEVTNLIFSSIFKPREMWVPPCFTFNGEVPNLCTSTAPSASNDLTPSQPARELGMGKSVIPSQAAEGTSARNSPAPSVLRGPMSEQEKRYLYHKVSNKGAADSVESLIGAYLVAGGIAAGLKFMAWMGIKLHSSCAMEINNPEEAWGNSSDLEEGEIVSSGSFDSDTLTPRVKKMRFTYGPVFIQNSQRTLQDFFHLCPSKRKLDGSQTVELNRLLSISSGNMDIQSLLGWRFRDCTLLLQAVTHASYTKNRLTECYQRLEFLGDAVLDYLVTCHIYSTFPDYGPGKITSMRSALVNNSTFAELAVLLKLHKSLLYNSPSLYSQIGRYLRVTDSCEQESMEELIIDSESGGGAGKMVRKRCRWFSSRYVSTS